MAIDAYASDLMVTSAKRRITPVEQAFQPDDRAFVCAIPNDQVVAVSGLTPAALDWTKSFSPVSACGPCRLCSLGYVTVVYVTVAGLLIRC